jgi:[ribosomal protein S5]-alanine N-acetyltransferase
MNLETTRLTIDNFAPEDWPALQELVADKEKSRFAFMDRAWPTDDEKIREICAWFAGGDDFLAVRTKPERELIGFVCLNPEENPKVRNLGYCLHSKFQGKGLAFEACCALIEYAFTTLNLTKIVTGTGLANTPSVKLLSKLGFVMVSKEEAHFRTNENDNPMVFKTGMFELTFERWKDHGRV